MSGLEAATRAWAIAGFRAYLNCRPGQPVAAWLHLDVIEVRKTAAFATWLDTLRDLRARAKIQARIERFIMGNPGDVEPVGKGVSELRIDYGPGYRVYFVKLGRAIVILLAGGDKSTQARDIKRALRLARDL